ncbi:hypothetical protein [uncultured Paraglaciecola sp.]|uniref:hypothetical protein n=1 Tax=uncultured Paraglaciecola sp. TaxID=1765024 RepID=UPI0026142484|nr:hypothetical protein [uncultured Paraglaciecola sp.]
MTFAAMPGLPQEGLTDAEYRLLSAIKQNIEELTGQGRTTTHIAVLKGSIATEGISTSGTVTGVNIGQTAVTVSGQTIPTYDDFISLANTTQSLINEVASLRNTVNALISELT